MQIEIFCGETCCAGIEGLLVDSLTGVGFQAHANVLGTLTGEQKNDRQILGVRAGCGGGGAELDNGFPGSGRC